MHDAAQWAEANRRRWAFSLSNAGAFYTKFRSEMARSDEINWDAVTARNFQPADIKEAKQAEFLVQKSFPWHLVERIGVHSPRVAQRAYTAMNGADHRPRVEIRREWYY